MRHLLLFALTFLAIGSPAAMAQQTMAIAAVVNDEAISMTDVEDRIKLVLASSGLPDGKEIRGKVMPQVINSLIEEQLKLQELRRQKLEITEEEINDGLKIIAEQNKFTPDQFLQAMTSQGIPKKTLLRQIKAQLAWNKVIKERLRRLVDVSETDVDTRIARMRDKLGQTEYLVSEIYLPLDDSARNAEVQQFAQNMAAELQAKRAPFGPVAAQFSKAAGAEKGGSLGWIQEGFLDPALEKVLVGMEEGSVSNPVKVNAGLYILFLQSKRTLAEDGIPSRDDLKNIIGFERLDRVQQRALLDLKSAAFIDRRV